MIKAVIFDCFGVLIGDALRMQGVKLRVEGRSDDADELHRIMRMTDLQLMGQDEAAMQEAEILDISLEELQQIITKGEIVDQALVEYIRTLKGVYKIGMLSNVRDRAYVEGHFPAGELGELFDEIVASGEVGYVKPDPEIYQIMLDRLGVSGSEAVMADDVEAFVAGAAAAGIHAILYKDIVQFKVDFEKILEEVHGH